MRLATIFSSLLLATSAQAAEMQSASFSMLGGHVNAGSNAWMTPTSPGQTGSAGSSVGGGISHGRSLGANLGVAGGFWAIESALAAGNGDFDVDGVPDASDNCIEHANPTQLDTDQDGYGNRCDYDYNNNGVVELVDFGALIDALGDVTATLYDNNGNGVPDLVDLGDMSAELGSMPGPSAFH